MHILALLFRRAAFALLLLSAGGCVQAQPAITIEAGLARHLLNRLGYGPAPGEVARVRAMGVQAWVDGQLAPPAMPRRLEERLRELSDAPEEEALLRAIASPRQLEEVLVAFWVAHFDLEQRAAALVRPYVLGRHAALRAALGQQARGNEADALRALLRHFVSTPSAGLERRAHRAWRRSRGDQRALLRLLLTSPEFLAVSQWNGKRKDTRRFVVSAVRASGLAVENVAPLLPYMHAPLSERERSGFVERLAAGELALAMAPVRPHHYASSAPPWRTVDEVSQWEISRPGPALMAAPTPSAAAMAVASRSVPAEPGHLRELLHSEEFLRY